jgi:hypothetical protein
VLRKIKKIFLIKIHIKHFRKGEKKKKKKERKKKKKKKKNVFFRSRSGFKVTFVAKYTQKRENR